jgi:hypothetical protein
MALNNRGKPLQILYLALAFAGLAAFLNFLAGQGF